MTVLPQEIRLPKRVTMIVGLHMNRLQKILLQDMLIIRQNIMQEIREAIHQIDRFFARSHRT